MIKKKIDDIVSNIVESTINGNLNWNIVKDSKYKKELESKSEDGLTCFEVTIQWRLSSGKFTLDDSYVYIRNKNLPNGIYTISYHQNNGVNKLRDILVNKYCKGFKPSIKEVESTLESINKGISKSTYRDSRLNKILNYISENK